ncbi:hypothetical protein KP77_32930 [Jeotgalibacillus alimentarius]|uniref:Bacterial Pleckstrin homology domain-containing protein n=1 Tax=Jeotgalibacillus alimentarius TaxID=135826 RepID=A0A0C2V3I1_9BACL|nr:PH domain-containing protein [Jeotgalibacillus alimentarius]KIL43587.1 hypothetical protein KP77_32930 [Jeotgalibacillus alimentarius]
MADLTAIMNWTFIEEVAVPADLEKLFVEGEEAKVAYKTIRDTAVITNKRLLIADKQGLTGKKVEIYTIPFKSIDMYSSENGGTFDTNAELELWTRSGRFKLNVNKKVDIRKLDRILAEAIL